MKTQRDKEIIFSKSDEIIFLGFSRKLLLPGSGHEMASHLPAINRLQQRRFHAAAGHRERAALVEGSTGGRVQRAGQLAFEVDALAPVGRAQGWRGAHQGAGVRVQRLGKQAGLGPVFDRCAPVHHQHVVGHRQLGSDTVLNLNPFRFET
jgi:hypothetical protein